MKRWYILSVSITLALVTLGLFGWGLSRSAMAAQQVAIPSQESGIVIPMGKGQGRVRNAYRAVLDHLYGGGRVHWAAASFGNGTLGFFNSGDFVIPAGSLAENYTNYSISATLPISRAYALQPGGVAALRSSVVVTEGQNQMVAMWELANVRQFLDGYLFDSLPYVVLDESAVVSGRLQGIDLLIVPAIRPDAVLSVTTVLSDTGALAALRNFVEAGGTLYAQSNGAYVAESAGLLPKGTVDLETVIELDPGSKPNRGQLAVRNPASPLAWSWLTDTLYVLTDPTLRPSPGMEVVATLSNAGDAPAIVRAEAGDGQVILVAGHPTDEARRLGAPVFMDAVLLALASRAELTGDAIQTWNPAYDLHEFPAYECVPISVTLIAANLWDTPINTVVVTEVVSGGYVVSETSISPTPSAFYTVTMPTTQTIIVWDLGPLDAGEQISLSYWAESTTDTLAAGIGTFSSGQMGYDDPELGPTEVSHRPFVLTAQMAARLVGDRDLELDRHYRILADGTWVDMALPLENKEWTLAHNVVVTDWVYLIYPFVDIENQHVILNANNGETIWMLNEPFLWGSQYPSPTVATAPTQTFTLDDWQGDWCVFTSTYGIHIDPPHGRRPQTEDYGSFVTIPPTYTQYITVTADNKLLLPCLPLTFDLGDWPGYWYEEPAVRYGAHSRELFSRTVVFHGTPRDDTVVMPYDAGSVYVAAGADPVPYREYLEAATPYAAAAPSQSGIVYQDVWSRTHFMPFRATFYDTWDWDSCMTCKRPIERHAAVNLTFGLIADLDGDGTPETEVREIPTRLAETWITLMGKTYNLGEWTIPTDMNLIDLPIFHGLGVRIRPRNGNWFDSYTPATGHTTLISVTETAAYDHLLFQQQVPLGVAEIFYVDGAVLTYGGNHEGMFKLHDGARFIYRQMLSGINRYEIYDSHVHSVMGLSSDGRVDSWAGPTAVSVYGDHVYYLYEIDDLYDPRTFTQDPYMNSWGYGDFVATVYVGGREQKSLFHSIVSAHDRTRARVSLDNNTGVTLTHINVEVIAPDWITVTQIYTNPTPDTVPEPIWPELAFLNVDEIPDAWRGVYYYDLQIGATPTASLGSVITLPVHISADGLPVDYESPPLVLALRGANDNPPGVTLGLADGLVLTDTLPANVMVQNVAVVNETEAMSLAKATDFDASHILSDTAAALFASFAPTLPFSVDGDVITFGPLEDLRTLPLSETIRIALQSAITRAHHGPNQVSAGGAICYIDPFGLRWCDQGAPLVVEAAGAVIAVDYFCEGGGTGVLSAGSGHCAVPPDQASEITLRITAYNEGDKLAHNVTVTPELSSGVTVVGNLESLELGSIAPGGWASISVTLQVTPTSDGIVQSPSGWRLPIVSRTRGQFTEEQNGPTISGKFGDAYALGVLWKSHLVYLPMCTRNLDLRSDLTIVAVALNPDHPDRLQVTITNQGNGPARAFWVDAYLDPSAPPEVNQSCNELGCYYDAAWLVDELGAQESLTLTIGDGFYQGDDPSCRWPDAYAPGEHTIWAYVDSWGPDQWGGVSEMDEGNNRYGPVDFTVEAVTLSQTTQVGE